MRRATTCLLVLLAAPALAADVPAVDGRRTIAVTGRGEVKAVPDRVTLSFAVETTAASARESATQNAKRSAAVATALRGVLGSDASVSTTRYTIEPRYEPKAREPTITGYVAQNQVQVETGAIDKAGALIDAAVGAGANRIGSIAFTLAKHEEAQRAALAKAAADAQGQAEAAARGLGVKLKGVLTATTGTPPVIEPRRFAVAAMTAEAAPTPIEPGEATVAATLNVTYEIE